jgi:hypothetical protein
MQDSTAGRSFLNTATDESKASDRITDKRLARNELALAAAGGLIVALLFWLIHWENLLWPAQLHMYLALVLIPRGKGLNIMLYAAAQR